MIKWRVASLEDIHEAFQNRKECFGTDDSALAGMLNSFERGRVYAVCDGTGNIGGVFGFVLIWTGVASCGAITTHHLDSNPLGYTRTIRDLITSDMKKYNVHRSEITVQDDFIQGHRWARALGFEWEGLLKQYGPDKSNYGIYGRVL